jgi:hypothetical protein
MESEGSLLRLQQPTSCLARKPDQSSAQTPPHFAWVRQEILKRTDRILEIKNFCHRGVDGMYVCTKGYKAICMCYARI